MSHLASLPALCLPPPVQPTTDPSRGGQEELTMNKQDHSAELKDAAVKRERPNVTISLVNSPASFSSSALATPPTTASSETMDIPDPGKHAYKHASPTTNVSVVGSPVEKPDDSSIKSPPPSNAQDDCSAKACNSASVNSESTVQTLKRSFPDSSLVDDASAADSAKRGRRNGKMFQCTGFGDCKMCFTRSEHLARHIRKHTGERPFECKCGRAFSRLDNLRQHIYTVHASEPQNYQTIKQCLPVHIPKKKEPKHSISLAGTHSLGPVLPGLTQVMPVPAGVGPGMAPMMVPAPSTGMGAQSMVGSDRQPAASLPQVPCNRQHEHQQVPPMTMPVGFLPAPMKNSSHSAHPPNGVPSNSHSSPVQNSRFPPVHYYAQQGGGQAPALVYMSDVPQMYCVPQQQVQIMPQYVTQYSYPVQVAYPPPTPGMLIKGAQPLSPPVSQAASPQVHMAPMPQ